MEGNKLDNCLEDGAVNTFAGQICIKGETADVVVLVVYDHAGSGSNLKPRCCWRSGTCGLNVVRRQESAPRTPHRRAWHWMERLGRRVDWRTWDGLLSEPPRRSRSSLTRRPMRHGAALWLAPFRRR